MLTETLCTQPFGVGGDYTARGGLNIQCVSKDTRAKMFVAWT